MVKGVMLNRPQTVKATAFNRLGYSLSSMDWAIGSVMPPAIPCTMRAGTNCASVWLSPHKYDATLYTIKAPISRR